MVLSIEATVENFEGDVSSVDSSSEQNFCLCFIQLISPVCLKLKVKWLNYKLKQMADQGEGLSISSWVGEPDRVAVTSEADS